MEGLIHISELSEKHVEHPKEVLNEGDVVTLRIIKISPEKHRIGLSLRKVDSMQYADMDWQYLLDEDEDFDEYFEEVEEEEEQHTNQAEEPEPSPVDTEMEQPTNQAEEPEPSPVDTEEEKEESKKKDSDSDSSASAE